MEGPTEEDSVHRPDDGPPVASGRGQGQQAHTGEPLAHLLGREPSLRGDDVEQVRLGGGVAPVEQLLQGC